MLLDAREPLLQDPKSRREVRLRSGKRNFAQVILMNTLRWDRLKKRRAWRGCLCGAPAVTTLATTTTGCEPRARIDAHAQFIG
jgi:hypothetical protein